MRNKLSWFQDTGQFDVEKHQRVNRRKSPVCHWKIGWIEASVDQEQVVVYQ